jgi:hypothetical protein
MDEARARRSGDAEAERANGDAAVVADFEGGALAPDIGPPRAGGSWAEDRAVLLGGELPSRERGHAEFAMAFAGVAMEEEVLEQSIGGGEVANLLGGEERRQAILPILMAAFDLALGLRSGGVAERDAVEMERGAELSEGVWDNGKEERMVVDIEFQREAVGEESGWEEVEIGEEIFVVVEAGANAEAATVVEHIEQGEEFGPGGEEAVRSSVELPEGTDFGALPAADWRAGFFGRFGGRELMLEGETPDGGRVEGELETAEDFAGGKAVTGGRTRGQELAQQRLDGGRPGRGMIAAGTRGFPAVGAASGTGAEIIGVEFVEA